MLAVGYFDENALRRKMLRTTGLQQMASRDSRFCHSYRTATPTTTQGREI